MRGIASIANAVAPLLAIAAVPAPLVSGARKPTSTESALSDRTSSALGRRHLGDHVGSPDIAAERGADLLEQPIRDARLHAGARLQHDLMTRATSLRTMSGTSATRR